MTDTPARGSPAVGYRVWLWSGARMTQLSTVRVFDTLANARHYADIEGDAFMGNELLILPADLIPEDAEASSRHSIRQQRES